MYRFIPAVDATGGAAPSRPARKEDLVARVLAVCGDAPGLVRVISAMESCPSYKPWLDKSNGHSALALSLKREGIDFVQEDNAFLRAADLARAQQLADAFNPERLRRRLTRYAHWLCPVADVFAQDDWHWSIRQAEYSSDLVFQSALKVE